MFIAAGTGLPLMGYCFAKLNTEWHQKTMKHSHVIGTGRRVLEKQQRWSWTNIIF